MKKARFGFICGIVSMTLCTAVRSQPDSSKNQIRHIEIVTFKPGTSDSSKHIVDKSFRQASDAFPLVKAFEWGWDANDKAQMKHIYVTTFDSKGDLTTYNASPLHQAATKKNSACIAQVTTVDYPVNK